MSNTQIRDLVHLIKSEDLTPAQIKSAFGEIYLSNDSISNQLESQEIVDQVRVVKAPFFGQHIPNTSQIAARVGDSGIMYFFLPSANKTYEFIAADVTNTGSGSVTVEFGVTNGADFIKMDVESPSAGGGQAGFDARQLRYFDSDVYPAFLVTSGTAGDVVGQLAYAEVIQ